MKTAEREYIYANTIVTERKWTKTLIQKFLGEPDKYVSNPHYRSSPQAKLYKTERVKEVEGTEEFQKAFAASRKMSESRKKSAEKQKQEILDEWSDYSVSLSELDEDTLYQVAIDAYNDHQCAIDSCEFASLNSDRSFLDRIAVNYLRHECCDYEECLADIKGRVGVADAYVLIKKKILDQIAMEFPYLKAEANRQKKELTV